MIVLAHDALLQEHLIERLQSVSYEAFKERKEQWGRRLFDTVQRKRFNRDPDAYLRGLEEQWEACVKS